MWPDAARRAANICARAKIFSDHGYMRTSELLLELAEAVESGKLRKPGDVFSEILSTYGSEYAKEDDFLDLHDFVESILFELRGD